MKSNICYVPVMVDKEGNEVMQDNATLLSIAKEHVAYWKRYGYTKSYYYKLFSVGTKSIIEGSV